MKCMAMRIDDPGASHDVADIKKLARLLRVETSEALFDIIAQLYPNDRITPETAFDVEEIAIQLRDEAS